MKRCDRWSANLLSIAESKGLKSQVSFTCLDQLKDRKGVYTATVHSKMRWVHRGEPCGLDEDANSGAVKYFISTYRDISVDFRAPLVAVKLKREHSTALSIRFQHFPHFPSTKLLLN